MNDIEKQVTDWHVSTFPSATQNDIAKKFIEEGQEMVDANCQEDFEEEFADMCIVFMAWQNKLGRRTLTQCIADKLAVNKTRTWEPDGSRKK